MWAPISFDRVGSIYSGEEVSISAFFPLNESKFVRFMHGIELRVYPQKKYFFKVFHERAKHEFVTNFFPHIVRTSKIKGSRTLLIPPDTTTKKKPRECGAFSFETNCIQHISENSAITICSGPFNS